MKLIPPILVSFILNFSTNSKIRTTTLNMGWHGTWDDILNRDGSPRWKVDDLKAKSIALHHIETHYHSGGAMVEQEQVPKSTTTPLNIFCPLAGDDPFVKYAWDQGHHVTALDLVPAAMEAMKSQFDGTWEKQEEQDTGGSSSTTTIWTHESGRATLYVGDMMVERKELYSKFHAIYDKDSFGALEKSMRSTFCQRLAEYTKTTTDDGSGGIVYIEVKKKPDDHPGRYAGPPYSVDRDDLMEPTNFGKAFEHVVSLGKVYDIPTPSMTQTGHVLKRMIR
mmetsp:Transcript_8011/g.10468  ORF Transcript_8011/g.10468 Transcript_8011/m.10468 type:complete len:279 (+) Transcript_8011:195-1031(+)